MLLHRYFCSYILSLNVVPREAFELNQAHQEPSTMTVANTTHIPGMRGPLLGLRIAQLVLAVIILALSSYGVYWIVYDGDALTLASVSFIYPPIHSCLRLTVSDLQAAISIVICVYVIVASTGAPVLYNYWAVLGLDIIAVILWVVSFPILASQIANAVTVQETCDSYYDYCYYYKHKRGLGLEKRAETTWETYKSVMIATSALGGLEL